MIWQNPWAWTGLVALVVPVLIHLLARRAARVQRFPALRFLDPTPLRPARRTRIRDPLLLIVRMAILAAAVAALAQPQWSSARTRAEPTIARAIIVDSSASMSRDPAVIALAREAAQVVAADASVSTVIVTSEPARMIPGAAAWLGTSPHTRELVILSDFQYGEVTSADLARIPRDIGVRLQRITANSSAQRAQIPANPVGQGQLPANAAVDAPPRSVHLLAGASETRLANATLEAAMSTTALPRSDTTRPVAIVFPNHEQRAQLLQNALPLNQQWQGDLLLSIADDTTIRRITRADLGGRNTLLLFTDAAPGTLAGAMLVGSVLQAIAQQPPPDEQESEVLGDDVLATWERTAVNSTATSSDASQGRWFWVLVLLLLGLEAWVRRAQKPVAEVQHERAA